MKRGLFFPYVVPLRFRGPRSVRFPSAPPSHPSAPSVCLPPPHAFRRCIAPPRASRSSVDPSAPTPTPCPSSPPDSRLRRRSARGAPPLQMAGSRPQRAPPRWRRWRRTPTREPTLPGALQPPRGHPTSSSPRTMCRRRCVRCSSFPAPNPIHERRPRPSRRLPCRVSSPINYAQSITLLEQMRLHMATDTGKDLTKKVGLVYQLNIAPKVSHPSSPSPSSSPSQISRESLLFYLTILRETPAISTSEKDQDA